MARQLMELAVHPERLKRQMKARGLTGNELARRRGLGKATISRLVSGAHNLVQPRVAEAIEAELQVEPGTFFAVSEMYRVPPRCKGCGTACATCGVAA